MIIKPLANEVSRFTDLHEPFRQQLRSSIEPDTASWGDERAFAASFDAALAAVLQRAVEPAFQERQHRRFGGPPFEAFAPQLLSTAGGAAHAVAELRFKGMDRAQPFVELSCFSCDAPAQLAELALGALAAFDPFCPRRARAGLRAADAAALAAVGLRVETDLHTLAASLQTLRSREDLPVPRLELRTIEDVRESYEYYASLFESFGASCPDLARELYRSSPEEFADMVSYEKSFEAFLEGRRVGLIAATPGELWGHPGWMMHEECLGAEHRGQGFGLDLQRALLERLEGEPGVLWGTIHSSNVPSLRTAQRHGRKIVQTHYWLLPSGGERGAGGAA